MNAYNPSPQEGGGRGINISRLFSFHSKFKASSGYLRPVSKTKLNKKNKNLGFVEIYLFKCILLQIIENTVTNSVLDRGLFF